MENEKDARGCLSLGRRVQIIEKKVDKQDRALRQRSCGEEDHYLRLTGRCVLIVQGARSRTATLKEVGRFTILIEDDDGEHVLNKGTIDEVSLVR